MFRRNLTKAPLRVRDGLTSFILQQKGDVPGDRMAITWVDVAPGAAQRPHAHGSEQVYIIVRGRGCMQVGDEQLEVGAGELIHIPSGMRHNIENLSAGEALTYISAATPAFDLERLYDAGDLARDRSKDVDSKGADQLMVPGIWAYRTALAVMPYCLRCSPRTWGHL